MKRKFFIFLMLLGSFSIYAQSKSEQEQLPQGKWVFESVSAFGENVQIPFSVNNIDFEIPAEIEVQQSKITFMWKAGAEKVNYNDVVRGIFLCFPVCAEWKITENKLELQWIQDVDTPTGVRNITLTYSLK